MAPNRAHDGHNRGPSYTDPTLNTTPDHGRGHLGVKWGLPADADRFHHNPKTLLAKKPSEQPQHR
jgi:hypothetical protein